LEVTMSKPTGTAHELLAELLAEVLASCQRAIAVRHLVHAEGANVTELLQERMFGMAQVARDIEAAMLRAEDVAGELRQRLDEMVAPTAQVMQ
jgi:hypothetical protein